MNQPITEILADNYLTYRQIELMEAHCVRVTCVFSEMCFEKCEWRGLKGDIFSDALISMVFPLVVDKERLVVDKNPLVVDKEPLIVDKNSPIESPK